MLDLFIEQPKKQAPKGKKYIMDYSFYIYNGSFAYSRKCECTRNKKGEKKDPRSNCRKCKGDGYDGINAGGIKTGGLFHVFNHILPRLRDGWDVTLVFDPPKENLERTKLIDAYKGNRPPTPEWIEYQMNLGELIFPKTDKVKCFTSDCDESDDVISTLALKYASEGYIVEVGTDDKDMFPLLDDPLITLYRQKQIFTKANFIEKFGFEPKRFSEYLAIVGDTADNYNIIKGLGPVAAKDILSTYDNIMDIFDDWDNVPKKYKSKLSYECEGNRCSVCYANGKKCEVKMRDELETSLQLAYLNLKADYHKIGAMPDKQFVASELERLKLTSATKQIDLLF